MLEYKGSSADLCAFAVLPPFLLVSYYVSAPCLCLHAHSDLGSLPAATAVSQCQLGCVGAAIG